MVPGRGAQSGGAVVVIARRSWCCLRLCLGWSGRPGWVLLPSCICISCHLDCFNHGVTYVLMPSASLPSGSRLLFFISSFLSFIQHRGIFKACTRSFFYYSVHTLLMSPSSASSAHQTPPTHNLWWAFWWARPLRHRVCQYRSRRQRAVARQRQRRRPLYWSRTRRLHLQHRQVRSHHRAMGLVL